MNEQIYFPSVFTSAHARRLDFNFINRQFECDDIPLHDVSDVNAMPVSIKHPQMADILLHNISIDRRMHASNTYIEKETHHTRL